MLGFPTRHLGPVQMTTDTALGVTKLIVHDHIPLNQIPYIVSVLVVSLFPWANFELIFVGPSHYPIQPQRICRDAFQYVIYCIIAHRTGALSLLSITKGTSPMAQNLDYLQEWKSSFMKILTKRSISNDIYITGPFIAVNRYKEAEYFHSNIDIRSTYTTTTWT